MRLSDFDYELPTELVAQLPTDRRTASRLMVVMDHVEHRHFFELFDYLKPDDVLVLNESKVLNAQLDARKETGGKLSVMIASRKGDAYACRIKGSGVRPGHTLLFPDDVKAEVLSSEGTEFILRFDSDVDELISKHGRVPLPPYIKSVPTDLSRYQTVYSETPGSLAAPTAGLHFSEELLKRIEDKGVKIAKLTLHVSFGTFDPVKVDDISKHSMEPEQYEVSEEAADIINNRKGRLIVVGTTSLKTLESATKNGKLQSGSGSSELFIYPGYQFKNRIDALVTNFHLPKSTLLMLVSAYYGRERMLELYAEAIRERYRLFSFGDAMLLFKE